MTVVGKSSDWIDVVDWGADPTGATDSSDAFAAAYQYAVSNTFGVGNHNAVRISRVAIRIPPGKYLIQKPESLAAKGTFYKQVGARFFGVGSPRIIWDGPDGSYLIGNDRLEQLEMEGIDFECTNPTLNFMESISESASYVGVYDFRKCGWYGSWNRGFFLKGGNVNSDNVWNGCTISAQFLDGFLHVPDDSSDQEVVHDFQSCRIWLSGGSTFARMFRGGGIHVSDGSLILNGDGITVFDLIGNSHSQGVTNLSVENTHIEMKSTTSKVVVCDWETGNIRFDNVDESSNTGFFGTSIAHEYSINTSGPSVQYENCRLHGQHEYRFGVSSHDYSSSINYESCEFMHYQDARDAIITTTSSANLGSVKGVTLEDCSGKAGVVSSEYQVDGTINWAQTKHSNIEKRAVVVNTASGTAPFAGGSETVKIPVGAMVTAVYWYSPAGAMTSAATTWQMDVTTGAGDTLSTLAPGTALSTGYSVRDEVLYCAETDAKRTITVASDAAKNQGSADEICLIEYYG